MTINTISDSERDPSQSTDRAQSPTDAAVDRLAELLPADALEDALKGLERDDITGPGGLLTQLAGRVIETALGAELTEHLGHPPGGVAQGANVRNGAGRKTVSMSRSARRATATAVSIPSSWPSARRGWPAWTTRSSASTPAA
jgi:hypothetical protein